MKFKVDLGCYEKWEMKTAEMIKLMRDIFPKWIPDEFLKEGKDKVSSPYGITKMTVDA